MSWKIRPASQATQTEILTLTYPGLLDAVSTELAAGLERAERALEYVRLQTYWKVGGHIERYAAAAPGANRVTHDFYRRLSADLRRKKRADMSIDLLKRCAQFFRCYPVFPARTPLTWTHYLHLMRVDDPKLRQRLERLAAKEEWTCSAFKQVLRRLKAEGRPVSVSGGKLVYRRGTPYTYQVCRAHDLRGRKILAIDCGFKLCRDIPEGVTQKLVSGQVVCSKKAGGRYVLTTNNRRRGKYYTYAARVLRVVDGDTLDLFIDPGFEMKMINERVRLRGINAPELSTAGGAGAREFLTGLLEPCPIVVIRTTRASAVTGSDAKGMFGRWLVDLFALPGCEDPLTIASRGAFVNQVMLDEGWAGVY